MSFFFFSHQVSITDLTFIPTAQKIFNDLKHCCKCYRKGNDSICHQRCSPDFSMGVFWGQSH